MKNSLQNASSTNFGVNSSNNDKSMTPMIVVNKGTRETTITMKPRNSGPTHSRQDKRSKEEFPSLPGKTTQKSVLKKALSTTVIDTSPSQLRNHNSSSSNSNSNPNVNFSSTPNHFPSTSTFYPPQTLARPNSIHMTFSEKLKSNPPPSQTPSSSSSLFSTPLAPLPPPPLLLSAATNNHPNRRRTYHNKSLHRAVSAPTLPLVPTPTTSPYIPTPYIHVHKKGGNGAGGTAGGGAGSGRSKWVSKLEKVQLEQSLKEVEEYTNQLNFMSKLGWVPKGSGEGKEIVLEAEASSGGGGVEGIEGGGEEEEEEEEGITVNEIESWREAHKFKLEGSGSKIVSLTVSKQNLEVLKKELIEEYKDWNYVIKTPVEGVQSNKSETGDSGGENNGRNDLERSNTAEA